MGDNEWPLRAVHRECGHLVRVVGEPAPERVIKGMLLARPEQEIIAWLAVQATVAGMPVGAHGREVDGIDQRCVGVGSEQGRSAVALQSGGERDRLACTPRIIAYFRRADAA